MTLTEIRQLLPAVFIESIRPGNPGYALLSLMETLHEPSERILADIDAYFDPRRTPDVFVPYLAGWLDLRRFFAAETGRRRDAFHVSIPLERLREWIVRAAELTRWRGTPKGLRMLLETASGVTGFEIFEGTSAGEPRPFHLRVVAPRTAEVHRALLERIIELEKPAYMTTERIEFRDRTDSN